MTDVAEEQKVIKKKRSPCKRDVEYVKAPYSGDMVFNYDPKRNKVDANDD